MGSSIQIDAPSQTPASGLGTVTVMSDDAWAKDKGGTIALGGNAADGSAVTFGVVAGRKQNAIAGDPTGYVSIWVRGADGVMFEAVRFDGTASGGDAMFRNTIFATTGILIEGGLCQLDRHTTMTLGGGADSAALNFAGTTAPTAPNERDVWCDGSSLKVFLGGVVRTVALTVSE